MESALLIWGGYEPHEPKEALERFVPFLQHAGFEVIQRNSLSVYEDELPVRRPTLIVHIVQNWTTGDLTPGQFQHLSAAVRAGAGLVGWRGGLCDAFRHLPAYQFMTGGQWLAHPNGSEVPYRVEVVPSKAADPVVAGISSFTIVSEQYYLAVDLGVEVPATTTFRKPKEAPWIAEAVVPAVWRRKWDNGRVFYVSWGHAASDFDIPEVGAIVERGMPWAAGRDQASALPR